MQETLCELVQYLRYQHLKAFMYTSLEDCNVHVVRVLLNSLAGIEVARTVYSQTWFTCKVTCVRCSLLF
jgi:hypothetical protein